MHGTGRQIFLSNGHDEYWTANRRTIIEVGMPSTMYRYSMHRAIGGMIGGSIPMAELTFLCMTVTGGEGTQPCAPLYVELEHRVLASLLRDQRPR